MSTEATLECNVHATGTFIGALYAPQDRGRHASAGEKYIRHRLVIALYDNRERTPRHCDPEARRANRGTISESTSDAYPAKAVASWLRETPLPIETNRTLPRGWREVVSAVPTATSRTSNTVWTAIMGYCKLMPHPAPNRIWQTTQTGDGRVGIPQAHYDGFDRLQDSPEDHKGRVVAGYLNQHAQDQVQHYTGEHE
ncbi:hypothetical protein PG989_003905 [Apiospora arundinis]